MTDIPGDSTTTSSISVGDSVVSTLETNGDRDWFAITLTAGQQVVISLNGYGATPVPDTYLYVRNSAGTLIASDDDGGPGLNSQIVFTATTAGTYYIDVGAYADGYTGDYQLTVSEEGELPLYTYQTYLHEIGHAMGLGHAGNYNGSASYPQDAFYANDA